ncbi:MAG: hypothetical protein ABS69_02585 [Nitrosomonadales bacterium SCN 54-20]|nr:MAG: hypothetical protein ABS69_02585 [Nitrosomonadales bacterium SCN 54-20]
MILMPTNRSPEAYGISKIPPIFSPATKQQRREDFDNYWEFIQQHGGQAADYCNALRRAVKIASDLDY